ncbi:D-2-hydroxyglutarate dehydrogenase (plasmid) [Cupriavidus necator H850]|uniref:FAD-binding oxidoreductase n=1 Tax=Cupriavidus necator TaxID=106590 RepID=UPI00129DF935|nr:FAD-binding oxidoreductase [Cupriavidus necator]KAI3605376.1 D-2-hydroxyglutarate dehydrogenase [Cupriavidus necator H850]
MTAAIDDTYLNDWSGTRYGTPVGLERPRTTDELASILREANQSRLPCAIQGGRTGVSGGASPSNHELIVSLERMNQIEEIDTASGIAIVGAGVVLENLQSEAEKLGWTFPIDLASRGTCQIGGNAATNAGGCRVIKYGTTRQSVLGLEAVLANGEVLGPPNRLLKNNAGYSLSSLFIGSEGTLGVIARLALRLVPVPPVRRTLLVALNETTNVADVLAAAKLSLRDALSAFEVMWEDFVEAAMALPGNERQLPSSFRGRRAVLIEVEGSDEASIESLLELYVTGQMEDGTLLDAVLSLSNQDAQDLWNVRDSVAELQAGMRPYVGFDIGVTPGKHDAVVTAAKIELLRSLPQCKSVFFGHVGDGNLHAVVGPCNSREERAEVDRIVYGQLPPLESSITAEHGVGRKRKPFLLKSRTQTELNAMKTLKSAMDPNNILNRGRIFDMP